MPPPASVVPSNIPTLHLYRHLLREITYLPPAFSGIISNQVTHQFHLHAKESNHTQKRLARARSTLRNIKSANHGSKACMAALISKGFGRSGKRRRGLLSQFVLAQGPDDSASLEALLGDKKAATENDETEPAAKSLPKNSFLDKWDRPKLLQFLKSQRAQQEQTGSGVEWDGNPIKTVDESVQVPQKNIWGKKPSETLVRAKQAKWWKRQADKTMPPLGKGEWHLLQRLSNGAQDEGEWKIPSRRTAVKPLSGEADQAEQEWNWEEYATKPTASIERARMVRAQQYFGECNSTPFLGKAHRNTIPERWFRRTYNQIWRKTAYMEQDPNTLKHKFTWGSSQNKLPSATERQSVLFEGVDDKGRELKYTPVKSAKP